MSDNTTLPGTGDVIASDDISGVKYQRIKLGFGVDGAYDGDVDQLNPLPIQPAAAYYIAGSGNTSTANLSAGATFTGTIEDVLSQPTCSLLINSDQPLQVTVQQFIDATGVNQVSSWVFSFQANQGFAQSFTLNGNYFRLIAQNVGTAATTRLNINTYYGTIQPAGLVPAQASVPVVSPDGVQLLSASITNTGSTSVVDTLGYLSIVMQLSGIWSGNIYFEHSNDLTNWELIPVIQRSSYGVQDIVNCNGIYTIKPSGRYLRATTISITGTASISILGRSGVGVDSLDVLSLVTDKTSGMELNVRPTGDLGRVFPQEPGSGSLFTNSFSPRFKGVISLTSVGNVLFDVPCDQYQSAFVATGTYGSGTITAEGLYADGWKALTGFGGAVASISNGALTSAQFHVLSLYGAERIRIRVSSSSAGLNVPITMRLSAQFVQHSVGVFTAFGQTTQVAGTVNVTPTTPTTTFTNSAATTNATSIKASAGTLYCVNVTNTGSAAAFVKFYNKASAPTVGTDVPVMTISIPASGSVSVECGAMGQRFATGIALAITNLAADSDTTAVTASQVKVATTYI
jgi:hypothetical protein